MPDDPRFHCMAAEGVSLTLDLAAGHVRAFEIEANDRRLAPLHTAPWVDDPEIAADESIPLGLRALSGDFFCAPFSTSDVDEAPGHGWPANSSWRLIAEEPHPQGGVTARFELERRVLGARLVKEFTLRDRHPFVYQRHVFGGSGALPVANHAMTHFSGRGRLFFSPKAYGETPATPLETDPKRGRFALAYPARFADLHAAPLAKGGTADLCSYPIAGRHEDFAILVEDQTSRLGWAAALREAERDIVLSLKNPRVLPLTMLWFSNGGRDYAPWNGRHTGVLGIEEGRTYSLHGHAASIAFNPLAAEGIPTALDLRPDGEAEIRNVVGALPLPDGWTAVASVTAAEGALVTEDPDGSRVSAPFDADFLGGKG